MHCARSRDVHYATRTGGSGFFGFFFVRSRLRIWRLSKWPLTYSEFAKGQELCLKYICILHWIIASLSISFLYIHEMKFSAKLFFRSFLKSSKMRQFLLSYCPFLLHACNNNNNSAFLHSEFWFTHIQWSVIHEGFFLTGDNIVWPSYLL